MGSTTVERVLTQVETDASQAVEQNKQLAFSFFSASQAADQLGKEIADTGKQGLQAAVQLQPLDQMLVKWRQHQRTEARYGNFLAAQIASTGLAAKGAAGEVTHLVTAYAFGGPYQLAFAAIVAAGTLAWKEHSRAQEEARKETELNAAIALAAAKSWDRHLEATRQDTTYTKAFREELNQFKPVYEDLFKQMEEMRKAGPGVFAYIKAGLGDPSGLLAHEAAIDRIAAKIKTINEEARKGAAIAGFDAELKAMQEELRKGIEGRERYEYEQKQEAIKKRVELERQSALEVMQVQKKLNDDFMKGVDERTEVEIRSRVKRAEVSHYYGLLELTGGNRAHAEELARIDREEAEKLLLYADSEAMRTRIKADYAAQRTDIEVKYAKKEEQLIAHSRVTTAASVQAAMKAWRDYEHQRKRVNVTERESAELVMAGLDALGSAIEDFTKGNVEALAKQAAVEAAIDLAKGLAALGLAYLGSPGAAMAATAYFQAAAVNAAVAGLAAGVAAMMGGGGGGAAPAATGIGEATGEAGGARSTGKSGERETFKRETVVIFGSPFMTEAEAARYWERAKREADRLDLSRRVNVS